MEKLSSTRRGHLRSLANRIKPTVTVGKEGLSEKVLRSVEQQLKSGELIKVKVLKNAPGDVDTMAQEIGEKMECYVIQTIGHVAILYKEAAENPDPVFLV